MTITISLGMAAAIAAYALIGFLIFVIMMMATGPFGGGPSAKEAFLIGLFWPLALVFLLFGFLWWGILDR